MTDLRLFETQTRETVTSEPKTAASRSHRRAELFVKVPLKEAAEAAKALGSAGSAQQLFIWMWLQHMVWWTKSRTFPVSNVALARYGIDKWTKRRALRTFEAARLISVEWRNRRAPLVTVYKTTGA
jgi:hypothetical protein